MTIIIGTVLVLIFALLLFVFQVRQSETAVVATFGKPTGTPYTNAGAYFKWPWPVQKVYKYDQRVQNFEDKYSQALTADSTMLMTSIYVGWKISDARQFLQVFPGDPSVSLPNAQSKLEDMLRSSASRKTRANRRRKKSNPPPTPRPPKPLPTRRPPRRASAPRARPRPRRRCRSSSRIPTWRFSCCA